MTFGEFDDFFDFRFGPFQMSGFSRPFKVGYSRTSDSHIVKLKLRKDIEKIDDSSVSMSLNLNNSTEQMGSNNCYNPQRSANFPLQRYLSYSSNI